MASARRCAKRFIAPARPRSWSPISIMPAREAVAASIGGAAFKCDVGQEKDILHVIEETERQFGPIALFCSNAGIGGGFDPLSVNAGGTSDEPWARSWAIHVMAHVYAARHLIPRMKARGGGYFLNTISAAGLLSQVGSPAYSTTKHARGRICRKSRDLAQGRRHQGFDPVPAGRRHRHAALDPEGTAIRRRRSVAGAGRAGCADGARAGDLRDPAAPAGARATCARRPRITTAGSPAWRRSRRRCGKLTGSDGPPCLEAMRPASVIASEAKQSIARHNG